MDALIALAGLAMLVIGAEILVRGSVQLALRARISPLVIGLTVVSMGTSMPELLVSLMAALKGNAVVAVGNVVGSNIVNITFILGASVLLFPLEVDKASLRVHWPVMFIVSLLFAMFIWDDLLSQGEGALFVLMIAGYVFYMVRSSRRQHAQADVPEALGRHPSWLAVLMIVSGVAGLAFGADLTVDGAVGLSRSLGVSDHLIALTVVAVGTSLPELTTSVMAAYRQQPDISLGNLIGSNIFNLLGILGTTAVVRPIMFDHEGFSLDLAAMLISVIILLPLMIGRRLVRWHGLVLCIAYITYIMMIIARG